MTKYKILWYVKFCSQVNVVVRVVTAVYFISVR